MACGMTIPAPEFFRFKRPEDAFGIADAVSVKDDCRTARAVRQTGIDWPAFSSAVASSWPADRKHWRNSLVIEESIDHRDNQQRQQEAETVMAVDARDPNPAESHRRPARSGCRHQNGAEPPVIGCNHGFVPFHPLCTQRVGIFDLENRLLLYDAEQHHPRGCAINLDRHATDQVRRRGAVFLKNSMNGAK